MIVRPLMRGHVCVTAHPVGCARAVEEDIAVVQGRPPIDGPRRVLVVGCSAGLGLALRIVSAFGAGAATVGVCYERPGTPDRTATAGWYNTAAFHRHARRAGVYARTIVGDAFSAETKRETVAAILADLGDVDLVVHSVAAPRRRDPVTGEVRRSTLKTIGEPFTDKALVFESGQVGELTLAPATEREIADTVAVMGGEDWRLWIDALAQGGVLADGVTTLAFSYVGSARLAPSYRAGTMGRAKEDLETTAGRLDAALTPGGGRALVSVMKAMITQSSVAVPMSALYAALLFDVMKTKGIHEGPVEQAHRLFVERLYAGGRVPVDDQGRIRLDDLELRADVQAEVERRWVEVDSDNVARLADLDGLRADVLRLYGFGIGGVDYDADVETVVAVEGATAAAARD